MEGDLITSSTGVDICTTLSIVDYVDDSSSVATKLRRNTQCNDNMLDFYGEQQTPAGAPGALC